MAHTIDDLVIEIADKYSKSTAEYSKNKEMLWNDGGKYRIVQFLSRK